MTANPTPTLPPLPSTIANLPLATTPLSGNEFVPISQNGVTKAVAANGFTITGPTGPAGPTGPTGPTGPAGGAANINAGTIGDLAYYATSGNTLSGLPTLPNGILATNGGSTPSIQTAIPNGVTATTPSGGNSSTLIATTAFVNSTALTLASGTTAVTQSAADASTKVATTAFVNQGGLTLGTSTATTQSANDNSTKVATTAYVATAVAAAPSGLVLLTTINASAAASVAFSSTYITNTYNKYVIEFDGVYGSAGNASLYLTVSTNNGSTYLSTGYFWAGQSQPINASTVNATNSSSAVLIDMGLTGNNTIGSDSTNPAFGTIKFSNPSATAITSFIFDIFRTTHTHDIGFGYNSGTTAINNIKIAPSSGTITGNFHLYGIAGT